VSQYYATLSQHLQARISVVSEVEERSARYGLTLAGKVTSLDDTSDLFVLKAKSE